MKLSYSLVLEINGFFNGLAALHVVNMLEQGKHQV